ncbi:TIGR03943 family putative permease subunit [Paenibacillus alkalitolerans]|uniref:TIGR03943 family putative permease subunit n=1 Tax=Paenibacillus alkalitolerans TaxID=2799335 RepID=UPI0018F50500|nr:TIGR03943 family protein [Paenibacillus alkalitolerans]
MTLHYLIRAIISAGFSIYILYLVKNGLLQYYIAPRMELYVRIAAVGLIMIAVYQAFAAFAAVRGEAIDCDCDHTPSPSILRNITAYGLLIAPLLFGYFLPDTALGSALAEKKGIVLSVGDSVSSQSKQAAKPPAAAEQTLDPKLATDEKLKEMFLTGDAYTDQYANFAVSLYKQDTIVIEESSFLEASTAIDLFMDRFAGKKIQIEGFVYREDTMANDQFVVARMAMECCSADSTPYGFLVLSKSAAVYPEDSWVRVTGTINSTDWDGIQIVSIETGDIEKIPAPDTPYVYPNYDILDQ